MLMACSLSIWRDRQDRGSLTFLARLWPDRQPLSMELGEVIVDCSVADELVILTLRDSKPRGRAAR